MHSNEKNNAKEITLRTLQIIRFVQVCGAIVSSFGTVGFMIVTAVMWLYSSETCWIGIFYACLTFQVAAVYAFLTFRLFEYADWKMIAIPLPEWLAIFLENIFLYSWIVIAPFSLVFAHANLKSPPLIYCLFAVGTFIASLACFASACETSLNIRKKIDPNFKVYRGF